MSRRTTISDADWKRCKGVVDTVTTYNDEQIIEKVANNILDEAENIAIEEHCSVISNKTPNRSDMDIGILLAKAVLKEIGLIK